MCDIIGDIHGHADELEHLLRLMGYQFVRGTFRHPKRKVVFLGDLFDRGPKIPQVLEIVRRMVEGGAALAIMGNHEFNALAFHTEDPSSTGNYLREHSSKNVAQHCATLLGSVQELTDVAGPRSLPRRVRLLFRAGWLRHRKLPWRATVFLKQ